MGGFTIFVIIILCVFIVFAFYFHGRPLLQFQTNPGIDHPQVPLLPPLREEP